MSRYDAFYRFLDTLRLNLGPNVLRSDLQVAQEFQNAVDAEISGYASRNGSLLAAVPENRAKTDAKGPFDNHELHVAEYAKTVGPLEKQAAEKAAAHIADHTKLLAESAFYGTPPSPNGFAATAGINPTKLTSEKLKDAVDKLAGFAVEPPADVVVENTVDRELAGSTAGASPISTVRLSEKLRVIGHYSASLEKLARAAADLAEKTALQLTTALVDEGRARG